jgi:hypothetical protein
MSVIGYGAAVAINDGAGNAFQDVPDLTSIDPPADEVGSAESKRLNLPGGVITSVSTLINPGEFSFTMEFDTPLMTRLESLKKVPKNFRITIPGTTSFVKTVPGFITKNETDSVEADKITSITTTVKITGPAS